MMQAVESILKKKKNKDSIAPKKQLVSEDIQMSNDQIYNIIGLP